MKDSAPAARYNKTQGCGSLAPTAKTRAAYALYLAKAVQAYRAAGLPFEHLAIQNEPNTPNDWDGRTSRRRVCH
jgi:O-glycosyl hydrolase